MQSGNFMPTQAAGFTYIGILIAVAIIGVSLSATGVVWRTSIQRDRESDLLSIGDQYRDAIGDFYAKNKQFPKELSDLLRDPNEATVIHYIRKIYKDPITATDEWGLVKDKSGGIVGVYSKSEQKPIKQAQFSKEDQLFTGKEKYSDWQFVFTPKVNTNRSIKAAANAVAAAQAKANINTNSTTSLPTPFSKPGTIKP